MTALAGIAKSTLKVPIAFLNQPLIKEGVKNVLGVAAFVFGIYEIYDDITLIREEWKNRAAPPSPEKKEFSWMKTAGRVLLVVSKLSLLASCFTSRPSLILCGWVAGKLFTPLQLQNMFGPNTIFAVNPYHPRHVLNLGAFILGLPALAKSVYDVGVWVKHKIDTQPVEPGDKRSKIIQIMATINTIFSRTMLHLVNQGLRFRV